MKRRQRRRALPIYPILLILLITSVIFFAIVTSFKPDIGDCTTYFCDVKVLTLKTNINVKQGTEKVANIRGKVIKFVTDPLTMYDNDGNQIAYGADEYHFIAQDSHMILVNNQPTVEMVGKFSIFGDKYDIYNMDGQIIAKAEFNMLNSYGTIVGSNGTLWADYHSNFYRRDYDVRIKDECKLDDTTILMMMASFYSDRSADSSSNSSNSNK